VAEVGTVTLSYRRAQLHTGVYFEDVSDRLKMIHFPTHGRLSAVENPRYVLEIRAKKLVESQRLAISNLCRKIWRNYAESGLRYSATLLDDFDEHGFLVRNKDGIGFTCSTFVMRVFEKCGAPLVDYATWPNRTEKDIRWLIALLDGLRGIWLEPSWAQFAADARCDWKRLLPQEIAAAAEMAPPPVAYSSITKPAKRLEKRLRASVPERP
jgi:hypothetical protein